MIGSGASLTNIGTVFLGNIPIGPTASQYSLGNLDLSNYKQVFVTTNNLRTGPNTNLSFANILGDQSTSNKFSVTTVGTQYVSGVATIDLNTGLMFDTIFVRDGSVLGSPVPLGTATLAGNVGPTQITTATTRIYAYLSGLETRSGNISLYGIR
jgi:hypothetical protein